MRRSLNIIAALVFPLIFNSCFKEDDMVFAHEQGTVLEGSVSMGNLYGTRIFYDLRENCTAASGPVTEWDLSFASSGEGWTIRLNSSKFMYAGNTRDTSFQQEPVAGDLEMVFDASNGDPDSTAIGEWVVQSEDTAWSYREVYLLDLGMDSAGNLLGFMKVQFETEGRDYRIRYARPTAADEQVRVISRDPLRDRIYFSFKNGVVDVAPPPADWSLLFTKYTTMLVTDEGENYPYIVNGVLLNPNGVRAALDTIHDFTEMQLADTLDLELTNRSDVIGYEWKYYDFDAGVYSIVPGMNYVIRDRDGFFYKFRFIDFYNNSGMKGSPRFEFVRL
jgi:hypothetical protein